jgi:hypothetical protein
MLILDIGRESVPQLFGPDSVAWTATVALEDGSTLSLSRYDDELAYLADSLFGPDGYPHFSHGTGSRSCAKRAASDELSALLAQAERSVTQ